MADKISNKAQFFQLWKDGQLGNRTYLWDNVWDAIYDSIQLNLTHVGFREIRKPGTSGSGAWELVSVKDIGHTFRQWNQKGRSFIIDSGAPNHLTTLCGEVVITSEGLQGQLAVRPYTDMRTCMRNNLLTPRSSLVTKELIKHFMDPSSQDDLEILLDKYPDHVIEFSCFSVNVGVLPHRNTIFWETRCY